MEHEKQYDIRPSEIPFFAKTHNLVCPPGFSRQPGGYAPPRTGIKKRQFAIIAGVTLPRRAVNGIFEEEITLAALFNFALLRATR